VELPPPGSLSGRLLLPSGGVPKQGVVYLEGTAGAGSSSPRDKVVLSQRGGRFSPDFLVIIAGQAVAFSNDDRLTHSIFSVSSAKSFDLGHALPGEARTLTFERPGVVELFCNIHQTEQATIVVVPSAAYALLTADGSYQLSSIPAGRYRLVAYAPQGGQLVQSVEIRPRERTVVNLKFGQAGPVGAPAKPR
jgi:plastocyanin